MIIEVTDNTEQFYYINSDHVGYIRKRKNYGTWKIVLINGEHILTDSQEAVEQIIKALSDKIMVMRSGKIIEFEDKEKVFSKPKDEYTKKLLSSAYL